MQNFQVEGKIVDIHNKAIYNGIVHIESGIIKSIERTDKEYSNYIMPGFIDSHVHIESSMLIPSEFARLAVVHGTVATVSDPHEIANVCGIDGINFMIENGEKVPFKFYFGAPSCVPATTFETAGATITAEHISKLFENPKIKYLSEMMNYPGVLFEFPDVVAKLEVAKKFNRPIDGHAPGLKGDDAKKYISAGITTDHECYTIEEALDKINFGMKVLIREGSAAKNYEDLSSLIETHTDMVMLCSDDKHPDNLIESHINNLVSRSIKKGYDLFKTLQVAILNPIKHYDLQVGTLKVGDAADFIVVKDVIDFEIIQTFIEGNKVAEHGKTLIESISTEEINNFNCKHITIADLKVEPEGQIINVIEALEGQLITNRIEANALILEGNVVSDVKNDILKLVVLNRYNHSKPAISFIKNIELKTGALATSVAHDSHNIIAVGTSDAELVVAINSIIDACGGLVATENGNTIIQDLNIGGIMSNKDAYQVARNYELLDSKAKQMGTKLKAPFMTLSFMALLVIPSIKLSDKGLFNGDKFEFISNFI